MYESPVNLILQDVETQMDEEIERTVINVVRKFDVDVDKGEIIKALKYDRNQYCKGYKDGVNDILIKLKIEIERLSTDITKDVLLDIIDKYKIESEEDLK